MQGQISVAPTVFGRFHEALRVSALSFTENQRHSERREESHPVVLHRGRDEDEVVLCSLRSLRMTTRGLSRAMAPRRRTRARRSCDASGSRRRGRKHRIERLSPTLFPHDHARRSLHRRRHCGGAIRRRLGPTVPMVVGRGRVRTRNADAPRGCSGCFVAPLTPRQAARDDKVAQLIDPLQPCAYCYYMKRVALKVARIGNSRGVRIPADTLQRYRIGAEVIMEETGDGILLRPKVEAGNKLSWEETARAMAAEGEDWSEWDLTAGDGLDAAGWEYRRPTRAAGRVADEQLTARSPRRRRKS
jgi:antitoxin component of MazEF toxin-antitoxin module